MPKKKSLVGLPQRRTQRPGARDATIATATLRAALLEKNETFHLALAF